VGAHVHCGSEGGILEARSKKQEARSKKQEEHPPGAACLLLASDSRQ
jgi:hypothetical protein